MQPICGLGEVFVSLSLVTNLHKIRAYDRSNRIPPSNPDVLEARPSSLGHLAFLTKKT